MLALDPQTAEMAHMTVVYVAHIRTTVYTLYYCTHMYNVCACTWHVPPCGTCMYAYVVVSPVVEDLHVHTQCNVVWHIMAH